MLMEKQKKVNHWPKGNSERFSIKASMNCNLLLYEGYALMKK